jgi:uncharacterized RDD family membrane protein YckC
MAGNWFVGRNGTQDGPYSWPQLQQFVEQGRLIATDLVWREGMPDWVAASAIKGLFPVGQEPAAVRNPYRSPASDGIEVEQYAGGHATDYAEYLPRVGAALLDGLFLFLFQCVPGFFIGLVFVAAAGNDPDARTGAVAVANICSSLLGMVISFLYYVILETSLKQGTWGKQIVGIKVTDLEGNRVTAGRAIGRWFAKFLTGCTLGFGLLMPLFTEKKQTLHDMIAGCLALKK